MKPIKKEEWGADKVKDSSFEMLLKIEERSKCATVQQQKRLFINFILINLILIGWI